MTPEPIADLFYAVYPEFADKVDPDVVNATGRRVYILYAVLRNGATEELKIAACMATAHYLARSSTVMSEGEIGGGDRGVVTNASVGNVSVGMQQKPVKDMFEDFFASTPYGQEFLAWLATVGGISYVN